jgi:hypothetical protein
MGDSKELSSPKIPPKSKDLSGITERFQGGHNYQLTLDKSFKRERNEEKRK